jgi:sarcosine oxidase
VHGKADFVRRTIETARACNIPHEELDAEAVMRRFPQFRLRGDEIAYFEPGGGFVRPERCVAAELLLARRAGAEIRTNTQVTGFARDGDGVCVTLQDGTRIIAGDAVLAAGAWSPGLAGPKLSSHLRVLRQTLHWFEPERPEDYAPERFPVFIWAHGGTENDSFYGFPIPHDGTGVKVACEQYCDALQNPDQVARDVPEFEVSAMFHKHVQGRLLGVSPVALDSKTCLYTMTPDGDFAIGCLPDNDRVLLVSACSGHGFKHSAGLGEAVAKTLISSDSGQLKNFALDRLLAYPSSAA